MEHKCEGCRQTANRLREHMKTSPYGKIVMKCSSCGSTWSIARGGEPATIADGDDDDPRVAFTRRKEQRPL